MLDHLVELLDGLVDLLRTVALLIAGGADLLYQFGGPLMSGTMRASISPARSATSTLVPAGPARLHTHGLTSWTSALCARRDALCPSSITSEIRVKSSVPTSTESGSIRTVGRLYVSIIMVLIYP